MVPTRLLAVLVAFVAACDSGKDQFEGFDAGIPADGGVWGEGEILTCSHDPLPAFDSIVWDLGDNFPSRDSIGSNYVVPPGAEDAWELTGDEDGALLALGTGSLVAHAIRTSPAVFSGLQTVAWVDVTSLDVTGELPSLFCRMEDANPPSTYYGLTLHADRLTVTESGEEMELDAEIPFEGLVMGVTYRLILSCHDRSADTLVTAFVYQAGGEGWTRIGCAHAFDSNPRGPGSVALGVQAGPVAFDNLRVHLP